jgi:hypothetical protein
MKINGLHEILKHHLFQSNEQNILKTGNDLVTELHSINDFFCRLMSILSVFYNH